MKLIHYIINNTIVYDAYYYNICQGFPRWPPPIGRKSAPTPPHLAVRPPHQNFFDPPHVAVRPPPCKFWKTELTLDIMSSKPNLH